MRKAFGLAATSSLTGTLRGVILRDWTSLTAEQRIWVGEQLSSEVALVSPVTGTGINLAYQLTLRDGRQVFAKVNPAHIDEKSSAMLVTEAISLRKIAQLMPKFVPELLAASNSLLLLEWLNPQPKVNDFWQKLAESL